MDIFRVTALGFALVLTVGTIHYYLSGKNHYNQGTHRLRKDDYEGAVTRLTKYLRRDSDSAWAHYYRV